MKQLLAHIKFFQGNWIIEFSRGGNDAVTRFSPEEVRDVANLWNWLASMTSRETPEIKWTKRSQVVERRSNGGWYHENESVALNCVEGQQPALWRSVDDLLGGVQVRLVDPTSDGTVGEQPATAPN